MGALTWSLGGPDVARFTIAPATGVVSLAGQDYETPQDTGTDNTYQFTVTATDADGNTATSTVTTITITDDDGEIANFTVAALADASIAENTAYTSLPPATPTGDTPVGALTWSLGGADAARFAIVAASGVVSLAGQDYETPQDNGADNTYQFTVTATDADGNADTSMATTITITDDDGEIANFTVAPLPDSEVVENTAYTSLPPAAPTGDTPVGALTWSLGGADAARFAIVAASGVVSLAGQDYENPQDNGGDNTYQFTVTATDADGNTATSPVTTITITNDDGETANFTVAALADAEVAENTEYTSLPAAAPIGDTPVGALTWSLGGADAARFSIVAASGVVSLAGQDYEAPQDNGGDNTYQFTVTATDADGNTATSPVTTITITDDNGEIANFTVAALDDASIVENTAYTSLPPAAPTGDTPVGALTWSLGGADAARFSIVATSGVVSLAGQDYENPQDNGGDNTYQFTVTATDADGNTDTSTVTTITITDDDGEIANFTVAALDDASIVENTAYTSLPPAAPTGDTPVGVLTWSLGGADAARFAIVAASGVVSLAGQDYENPQDNGADNTYQFTVTATDADGNTATSPVTIITITNDDGETANFTVAALADAEVAENTEYTSLPAAAPIGDTPVGALTWRLGGADAARFSIVAASGVVSLAGQDYEAPQDNGGDNTYQFTVTATDADGNTATSPVTTITITDDNGEIANFTVVALADAEVAENTAYTSLPPAGPTGDTPVGTLTWSLGGPDAARFSIVAASGVVSLAGQDYEAPQDNGGDNTYQFTVTATDADGNTDTSTVTTITITDDDGEIANFTVVALADAEVAENTAYTSLPPRRPHRRHSDGRSYLESGRCRCRALRHCRRQWGRQSGGAGL